MGKHFYIPLLNRAPFLLYTPMSNCKLLFLTPHESSHPVNMLFPLCRKSFVFFPDVIETISAKSVVCFYKTISFGWLMSRPISFINNSGGMVCSDAGDYFL